MWHMHTPHCSYSHSARAPENFLMDWHRPTGRGPPYSGIIRKWQLLWPLGNGGVRQLSPCKKPLPSISALPQVCLGNVPYTTFLLRFLCPNLYCLRLTLKNLMTEPWGLKHDIPQGCMIAWLIPWENCKQFLEIPLSRHCPIDVLYPINKSYWYH